MLRPVTDNKFDLTILKFMVWGEHWVSDSANFIFVALLVWVGLAIVVLAIVPFAIFGATAWWDSYVAAHPGINIESTAMYWAFTLSLIALKIVFFIQTVYMVLIVGEYLTRDRDFNKRRKDELSYKFKIIDAHADQITRMRNDKKLREQITAIKLEYALKGVNVPEATNLIKKVSDRRPESIAPGLTPEQIKKHIVDPDTPQCPVCHSFDQVIKKGERGSNKRYYCKRDNRYFLIPKE